MRFSKKTSVNNSQALNRRTFLKRTGLSSLLAAGTFPLLLRMTPKAYANELNSLPAPPKFTPFTRPLPVPPRLRDSVLDPAPGSPEASLGSKAVYHGIAPEYSPDNPDHKPDWATRPERRLKMSYEHTVHQWIPGVMTPSYGYNGIVPGPIIRARMCEPMVLRMTNNIETETSLHLHGGHTPSHADGHPCYYVFPHQSRDYYYPHIIPRDVDGTFDTSEAPSTMWFHDHGNDVTAHNVAHGLTGFCLFTDNLEESLIDRRILPPVDAADGEQSPYDLPMAFTDQALNPDGTIYWDPLDHDGRLGNIFCVNGVAQPYLKVERRKYRFRWLGASLARVYELRIANGKTAVPLLQIGNDSWLLPNAINQNSIMINPAKRADVIVDFSKFAAGTVLYLQNIMQQQSGRGPDGVNAAAPTNLMKIVVGGSAVVNDVTVTTATALRPHKPILSTEIKATRTWDLGRSNGAWVINSEFYSAFRCDAAIEEGTAERWIISNSSGGWVHPIHIHLESHTIKKINGVAPRVSWRYKSDHVYVGGGETAEIWMKFRTFKGPFVFHCHNNNHEDMRMMRQMEVVARNPETGLLNPPMLNGKSFSVDEKVCGIPAADIKANPVLFS